MKWTGSLFIDNARYFAMLAESQWKNGAEDAKALSTLFEEKGMARCHVLDVPCGIGRVSVPLAKLGYEVEGIDLSPYFIRIAKNKARKFGVTKRTTFAAGLMKEVGSLFPRESFDAAINIWTSIGYGSEEDDLAFFKGLRQVVRKGGLFVMGGLASRDFRMSHFVGTLYDETDQLLILEKNELDIKNSRIRGVWRFYLKKGGSLKFAAESPQDVRLYSPHELVRMLEDSRWKVLEIYESLLSKRLYSPDYSGMAIVAVTS